MGSVCSTKSKDNKIIDTQSLRKSSKKSVATEIPQTIEKPQEKEEQEFEDENLKFFIDPSFYESMKLGRRIKDISKGMVFTHSEEIELSYTFFSRSSILLQICDENNINIPENIKSKLENALDSIFTFLSKVKEESEEERSSTVKYNVSSLLYLVIELYYFIYFIQDESDFSFMESRWWRPKKDEEYTLELTEKIRNCSRADKLYEESQQNILEEKRLYKLNDQKDEIEIEKKEKEIIQAKEPMENKEEVDTESKKEGIEEERKSNNTPEKLEEEHEKLKTEEDPDDSKTSKSEEKKQLSIFEYHKEIKDTRKSSFFSPDENIHFHKIEPLNDAQIGPRNSHDIPDIHIVPIYYDLVPRYIEGIYSQLLNGDPNTVLNKGSKLVAFEAIKEEVEEEQVKEKGKEINEEEKTSKEEIDKLYNLFTGKEENLVENEKDEDLNKGAIIQEAD